VPRENLLGELNGGWPITQGSLAHERAMLWVNHAQNVQRIVEGLIAEHPDERFHDTVASLYIDSQAMSLMGYLGFSKYAKGKSAPEHSLLKLFGSQTQRKAFVAGVER